jgi:group I intron endonuclease
MENTKYYIYKIVNKNNKEEFYIGSTNNFSSRKCKHKKSVCNKTSKKYWCKLYQYIRANGGWESFEMSVLEAGTCEGKEYIKQKEQEYINKLKPTLNSISAYIVKDKIPLISISNNTVS